MRLKTVLRSAVLLGLATPATIACSSSPAPSCTVTRPNPLPTTAFDGGCTLGTTYAVTVSDVSVCESSDAEVGGPSCDSICGQPVQSCAQVDASTTFSCTTLTVCGLARASFRRAERKRKRALAPIDDAAARARIDRARARAGARLIASLGSEPPNDLVDALGLPTASQAVAIASELRRALW